MRSASWLALLAALVLVGCGNEAGVPAVGDRGCRRAADLPGGLRRADRPGSPELRGGRAPVPRAGNPRVRAPEGDHGPPARRASRARHRGRPARDRDHACPGRRAPRPVQAERLPRERAALPSAPARAAHDRRGGARGHPRSAPRRRSPGRRRGDPEAAEGALREGVRTLGRRLSARCYPAPAHETPLARSSRAPPCTARVRLWRRRWRLGQGGLRRRGRRRRRAHHARPARHARPRGEVQLRPPEAHVPEGRDRPSTRRSSPRSWRASSSASSWTQKAPSLDVKVSDEQVQKQLDDLKKQYFGGDEKKYLAELKRQCVTDPEVRNDLRANLLSNAVFKKVTAAATVTDGQIKDYYDTHREVYTTPQTRVVRHILVAAKDKALADKLYGGAEGRRRLRDAREEVLDRPGLEVPGRRADDHTRPDGARVRQDRLRARHRRALEADQDPVRLAHHPARRSRRSPASRRRSSR